MLLKTVRTTKALSITLDTDMEDEKVQAVIREIRDQYFAKNPGLTELLGPSIDNVLGNFKKSSVQQIGDRFKPYLKEEEFTDIHKPFKVIHTNLFNGFPGVPENTVAVIQHTVEEKLENIYITGDQEAYLISPTGVTVSVVNGKGNDARLKEACAPHNRGQSLIR